MPAEQKTGRKLFSRAFWGDVLFASLPMVVLFLVFPVELYLPNQGEFNYNLVVLAPYAVLFMASIIVCVLPFLALGSPRRTQFATGLFWVGLFLLLSDIVAPVQLGLLDGTELTPREPLSLIVREALLAVVLLVGAVKIPAMQIRRFGLVFVGLLLVLQPVRFLSRVSEKSHLLRHRYDAAVQAHPKPAVLTTKPNVYHLTWDAYSSFVFEKQLQENAIARDFDGFVFFRNNRTNYLFTTLSRASYLTGSFYDQGSLLSWILLANSDGIPEELYRADYEVWSYVHSGYMNHQRASHARTNVQLMVETHATAFVASFADLWLVRVVPTILQDEVFFDGKGTVSRLHERIQRRFFPDGPASAVAEQQARAYYSVALARKLVEDEPTRPPHGQYVYVHIYLPHGANVMDPECSYAPESANYETQSECAMKLIREFLIELKRLGRYEDSLIILQSDHSAWDRGPVDPSLSTDTPWNANVIRHNLVGKAPVEIDNMSRAFLTIKPPGRANQPLEISDRPTQLVDIPATLYDLMAITPRIPPKEGKSVIGGELDPEREQHLFLGYKRTDEHGRPIFLGRDFDPGELNHFSFSLGRGWKRYSDIPARW